MHKVFQLDILCQFKDVLINLQCFNLFLCSHIFLFGGKSSKFSSKASFVAEAVLCLLYTNSTNGVLFI